MAETGYETPGRIASASTTRRDEPVRGATEVERIELKKTANGGFIGTCYKKKVGSKGLDDFVPPKDYAFSTLDEALDFARTEFGGGPSAAAGREPDLSAPSGLAGSAGAGDNVMPARPSRPKNTSAFI